MADLSNIQVEDLLDEGLDATLAVLFALQAGDLLNTSPADPYAKAQFYHALRLFNMLEDKLRAIRAEVDARWAK